MWSNSEILAAIGIYLTMLDLQIAGKLGRGKNKVTKAQLIRSAQNGVLANRSRGSIEYYLCNISHCRKLHNLEIVKGYLPMANCSKELISFHNNWIKDN